MVLGIDVHLTEQEVVGGRGALPGLGRVEIPLGAGIPHAPRERVPLSLQRRGFVRGDDTGENA